MNGGTARTGRGDVVIHGDGECGDVGIARAVVGFEGERVRSDEVAVWRIAEGTV